jgi:hypothetical protein
MIQSPVTGEWHDYGFSNVRGDIAKPEDMQWTQGNWGWEADQWQPTTATISVVPQTNPKGKITGFKVSSTGFSTTRLNTAWADMDADGTADSWYDRTTTEYYTGGSLTGVEVNGKPVAIAPVA